ncbi:MAG: TolC family protein [Phycisphaerales bacterium]|nr:MAG: TolC family protein [Phycisphaerales bacterium]
MLTGCGPKNYKKDADDRVYGIINQKWESDFGSQSNYRISDVAPSPGDIQIDRAVPSSGVLTLPQAVAIATAHNREYQTEKELLYTTALDLRLVRHDFETSLFGIGRAFYEDDGAGEEIGLEANVGFNRLLTTGTQIAAGLATAWTEVLLGTADSGLSSVFTASVMQPLLRGSDRAVVVEKLTQAERDTLYRIRTFNRFRKTFVVWVITQYYRALELQDLARNAEEHHRGLETLYDQVVTLTSVGRLPMLEADRLGQEMLQTRDTMILAQKAHDRFLDRFKITLGLATTTEFQLDDTVFAALAEAGVPAPEIAVDEVMDAALLRRLDMANSADAVLDAQRAVHVAADSLRADLRVGGKLDINDDGDATGTAEAILDLPLDRVAAQNVYRKALIALAQRRRDYDLKTDTVRLEVRQAHRKLQQAAERYRVQSEARELARERLEKTAALLQYGRVSSRRVLAAQQDLYSAENAATLAVTNHAVAVLDFYRDTGALQVRPDGMWERAPGSIAITGRTAADVP